MPYSTSVPAECEQGTYEKQAGSAPTKPSLCEDASEPLKTTNTYPSPAFWYGAEYDLGWLDVLSALVRQTRTGCWTFAFQPIIRILTQQGRMQNRPLGGTGPREVKLRNTTTREWSQNESSCANKIQLSLAPGPRPGRRWEAEPDRATSGQRVV
jgi:hypothetical protein